MMEQKFQALSILKLLCMSFIILPLSIKDSGWAVNSQTQKWPNLQKILFHLGPKDKYCNINLLAKLGLTDKIQDILYFYLLNLAKIERKTVAV